MTIHSNLLLLIPAFPLVGAIVLALCLRLKEKHHWQAGWVATILAAASFAVSCFLFRHIDEKTSLSAHAWQWFAVGELRIALALSMDRLAAVMTLIVTGVGSLIHLYSIGYMSHDDNRPRFFCYLNLFLFAMLLLVLGSNMLVMFVGWEGVGLCSYLLIGFWFKEMPNAKAGQKAFVVNRIGDAGFLLGMFLLFWNTTTLDFLGLEGAVSGLPPYVLEVAALLLFIGAIGKSAQIPLYIWLPDAMAGPTPVSALIHAATMVTAGIYMITRMSFLYVAAPNALVVISVIGTATAFLAATIALVQNDIKKVLAYSTVSQLGYMFMALGAGAFSYGIYHVVTHAFFKACLFMAAGSVIMGCHHEQDMRKFGGLWSSMTGTFLAYLAATYAITGLPGGSGFYSKDSILWSVYSASGKTSEILIGGYQLSHVLWFFGVVTAFLTAFYMTRSLVMTFFGKYRGEHEAHESPWTVLVPLAVLMFPSVLFGFMYGETLLHFLSPWTPEALRVSHEEMANNHTFHALERISMMVAIAGVVVAALVYLYWPAVVAGMARMFKPIYQLLVNKWWVDELYEVTVIRPLHFFSNSFAFRLLDRGLIDGSVNGAGQLTLANGEIVRRLHGGKIANYALLMFAGTFCAIVFWLIL